MWDPWMCSLWVHRANDGVRAGVGCAVPWVRRGWVLGPTPLMDTEGTLGLHPGFGLSQNLCRCLWRMRTYEQSCLTARQKGCWVMTINHWGFACFRLVIGALTETLTETDLDKTHSNPTPQCLNPKEHDSNCCWNFASLLRGSSPGTLAGDPGSRRCFNLLQMELLTSRCRTLPQVWHHWFMNYGPFKLCLPSRILTF